MLTSGPAAIADAIKDMRAILSVNLLKNDIGIDQARALVSILKEHPTLKSLCGNTGVETKLDMSSKMRGAEDAIMLAAEIIGNGALMSLDISSNSIGICDDLPEGWTYTDSYGDCYRHKDGNRSSPPAGAKSSGIVAIANAIPDMGALIKLDISSNQIGRKEELDLQRICVAGGIELAK
jgi:hypothetical protein